MHMATPPRAAHIVIGLALAAIASGSGLAGAGTPSSAECAEGAEFIGNAAWARENGMSRASFIEQMQADFVVVRSFPDELRWFVHDPEDESFLVGAARDVFDRPLPPDLHRVAFFRACMSRLMV